MLVKRSLQVVTTHGKELQRLANEVKTAKEHIAQLETELAVQQIEKTMLETAKEHTAQLETELAVRQIEKTMLEAKLKEKTAQLQAEKDSHNGNKPSASDDSVQKPYIRFLVVFLSIILVSLALVFVLQIADERTRGGIWIGILFCLSLFSIFIIVSSGLFILKRLQLLSFFGIDQDKPNIHIYISRLQIKEKGSEGAEPVTRGYIGPAITAQDYHAAQEIRDLLRSNLLTARMPKGLKEISGKIGGIFADIDPPIDASPEVKAFDKFRSKFLTSNLVIIGSNVYNAVSRYYLGQPTSPYYFDRKEIINDKGERDTERMLIERKLHREEDEVITGRSQKRELAIILRIKDYDHDGITVFICAGLGSSATRGSANYLVQHWQELQHDFGSYDFALCLEFDNQPRDSEKVTKPTCSHEKWRKYDPSGQPSTWVDGKPHLVRTWYTTIGSSL